MLTLRRNTYYLPALSPPGILLHHAHYSGFFSNVICYGIYTRYIVHGISEARTFTVICSSRSLKRERELLARRMRGQVTEEEREELYIRWGVPVDSKQRKLQLMHKVWTDPHNLSHIQASAAVVAKIVGILNPGCASKEMFALNFAPPGNSERPFMFGWNGLSALLNF
jgi:hypothetical protein